ncbi:MAG: hypothetical protein J7M17_05705 [Anaerolineae bacterium]|nr:hypothetical protein [Anaerolineae bacterium]
MPDPITDHVVQILNYVPETFVPLGRLYDALANEGLMAWTDLETFARLLEVDERFDLIADFGELIAIEGPPAAWKSLGWLGGPWVLLHSRRNHPRKLLRDLLRHLHRINQEMERVWPQLPNDPEVQANLISLLMLGDMLERRVKGALDVAPEEGRDMGRLSVAHQSLGPEAQSS